MKRGSKSKKMQKKQQKAYYRKRKCTFQKAAFSTFQHPLWAKEIRDT